MSISGPFFSLLANNHTQFIPYQASTSERMLHWLVKRNLNKPESLKRTSFLLLGAQFFAGAALSLAALSVSTWLAGGTLGLSLYWMASNQKRFNQISCKEQFLHSVPSSIPNLDHPMLKSTDRTFNQTHSLYLDINQIIWFAPRLPNVPPNWQALYLESYIPGSYDKVDIKADGQNFMAKVTTGNESHIFYKKIFEDSRGAAKHMLEDFINRPDSINRWFSLPILSVLSNHPQKELKLQTKQNWAMSNAGALRRFTKDANANLQPMWNVTTVYEQHKRSIKLYDPFVPPGLELKVSFPPRVAVWQIEATSSHLFVLGQVQDDSGLKWVLFERTLDYDHLGQNPIQSYSYKAQNAQARCIPNHGWTELEVPHQNILHRITVIQFGEQNQTEIRIPSKLDGVEGFYYRSLENPNWKFQTKSHADYQFCHTVSGPIHHQSYKTLNVELFAKHFDFVEIEHIDKHSELVKGWLKTKVGPSIQFYLHKTRNFIQDYLRGETKVQWNFVLSAPEQTSENEAWLGGASQPITLSFEQHKLLLKHKAFELELVQKECLNEEKGSFGPSRDM